MINFDKDFIRFFILVHKKESITLFSFSRVVQQALWLKNSKNLTDIIIMAKLMNGLHFRSWAVTTLLFFVWVLLSSFASIEGLNM